MEYSTIACYLVHEPLHAGQRNRRETLPATPAGRDTLSSEIDDVGENVFVHNSYLWKTLFSVNGLVQERRLLRLSRTLLVDVRLQRVLSLGVLKGGEGDVSTVRTRHDTSLFWNHRGRLSEWLTLLVSRPLGVYPVRYDTPLVWFCNWNSCS
jgi:hypothetical protein